MRPSHLTNSQRTRAYLLLMNIWLYIAHELQGMDMSPCHAHTKSMSQVPVSPPRKLTEQYRVVHTSRTHVHVIYHVQVIYLSRTHWVNESRACHQGHTPISRTHRAYAYMKVTNYTAFTCHTRPQSTSHIHVIKAIRQSRELTEQMHIYNSSTSHQIYYESYVWQNIVFFKGLFCQKRPVILRSLLIGRVRLNAWTHLHLTKSTSSHMYDRISSF